MNDFNKWVDSLIGRFDDTEPIIEIDLRNGEPQYFAADELGSDPAITRTKCDYRTILRLIL